MLETRGETLRFERRLAAPRRLVFAAVTEPAMLRRWMCPEGCTLPEVEAEPVAGGVFRLAMGLPDGRVVRVEGRYLEVLPPERVVFSWTWQPGHSMAGVETLITIALEDAGRSTRMVMTHERLRDVAEREDHRRGWTEALGKLERLMEETG
jgi:uncharacterized protein YndB with AHSA1/START domain